MKKIENIIDNCKDCKYCQKFNPSKGGFDSAFICEHTKRLITLAPSPYQFEFPNWCPLETYAEHSVPATETPATVVLDCMPHLEWMTENLTGHGGTEVDGRWYYTYDQAIAAAKKLGEGWRLPTAEKFKKLCDAGSTWVDNGPDGTPGRWFGGNHDTDHEGSIFLPAAGYLNYSTGAVTNVAAEGAYWRSSPYSSEVGAGNLGFDSGGVYPVSATTRAYGFSVRCIREL